MTDRQVRDEAMTLFIAGHETTANALTWTFFLLAQHPEIAATLRAELDRALAGRIPSAGDLPALPYTEMVIRESMRLYPPAWIVSRIAVDDVTIGGQALRRGNILLASPYALHRDARFFESPDQFMPERFAPEREKMLPRYAYFPFGVGPRVCIGNGFAMLEARLVLATLASQCDLSLVPGQRVVPEPLVTLRPKGGMRMRVKLYASPRCAPPTTTNTIPLS
jgi:cytochrome P450